LEEVIEVILFTLFILDPDVMIFRHDPLVHIGIYYISKMYFSYWEPPGVTERMWSVHLDASVSGEYQTL
jgi:hypothetical protein